MALIGCLIISSCNTTNPEDELPTIGEVQSSLDKESIVPVSVEFFYWNPNASPPTYDVIATNVDIEKVEVRKIDTHYKFHLVIQTTPSGTEKLKNSIGKYPDCLLAVTCDNKLMFPPVEEADIHSGQFRSESFYDIKEMVKMSLGIMKMKDQIIPNQQVDPIVTTPVDKVEAQSTQGHP